jgi:hypothetical protein
MGEFISMSGMKGSTRTDVVQSLRQFASSKGGLMEQASPRLNSHIVQYAVTRSRSILFIVRSLSNSLEADSIA